ncbi:MAG: DNA alkylation repair protein [Alphaproteobacteria bacterium]|jgi:3-methyladenine DNA glycosylase AlkD|nr:DNA alkylation repair protein [Alphaproteobacteria bacterium]
MINFIEKELDKLKNPLEAVRQAAYMRDKFKFLGIKKPLIKNVSVELLKEFKPNLEEIVSLANNLYYKEYREYQYVALYLLEKIAKKLDENHLLMLEKMILHDSWWDSVDVLSSNIIGIVLFKLPIEARKKYLDKWENSGNMWLLRVCIIHQLKYKIDTNTNYLAYICQQSKTHQDFFIRKAIGWALREFSKTNYSWVQNFVNNNLDLSPLSKKEALRIKP